MKNLCFLILALFVAQTVLYASPQTLYNQAYGIVENNYFDINDSENNLKDWKTRYDGKLSTYNDSYVAIETFVETLSDKYTRFLRPEEKSIEQQIISSEYEGYGLELSKKRVCRISPTKNSPAEKAGIMHNDILTEINKTSVSEKNLNEICDLIDQINPAPLNLKIKRKGETKTFTVNKGKIIVSSISQTAPFGTKIPDNIGYFYISSFNDKYVSEEFYALMKKNLNKDGYIIDLRGNGGGIVKYAAEIANMFLKNKKIFTMIDAKGNSKTYDANEHLLTDKPLVVLINGSSASASEILSGALQDNKRAVIVGEKSFGKGIMQKRFDLENGCGIRVTVDKYLTPNGNYIHHKGITPDVEVKLTKFDALIHNDKHLKKALKIICSKHI